MIRNGRGMISAARERAIESKQAGCTNSPDRIAGLRSRERAALGATLGATGANDIPGIRTSMNSGQGRASEVTD